MSEPFDPHSQPFSALLFGYELACLHKDREMMQTLRGHIEGRVNTLRMALEHVERRPDILRWRAHLLVWGDHPDRPWDSERPVPVDVDAVGTGKHSSAQVVVVPGEEPIQLEYEDSPLRRDPDGTMWTARGRQVGWPGPDGATIVPCELRLPVASSGSPTVEVRRKVDDD
jgi:hypothetical protein